MNSTPQSTQERVRSTKVTLLLRGAVGARCAHGGSRIEGRRSSGRRRTAGTRSRILDVGFPGQGAPVQSPGRIQRLWKSVWRLDSTLGVSHPTGSGRVPVVAGDRDNRPVTMS